MKIINDGLPEPLYRAVCDQRQPDPNQFSITQLIGPPKIKQLMEDHWDELEEAASDRIWLADGNAMHDLLERHGQVPGFLTEHHMEMMVSGVKVSGTLDTFDLGSGILTDYKRVGIASLYNGIKPEWERQLNCYAHMLRASGYEVTGLAVCVIYRDWMKAQTAKQGYPQKPVEVIPVAMWEDGDARLYLEGRVAIHLTDKPDCTDEERWVRSGKYAVVKPGNTKARRVCDTHAEAVAESRPGEAIVLRPGMSVRCQSYCPVLKFCKQGQEAIV